VPRVPGRRRPLGAPAPLRGVRGGRLLRRLANRHAIRHHEATSHPIIRSLEPGEDWYWCYEDELAFRVRAD